MLQVGPAHFTVAQRLVVLGTQHCSDRMGPQETLVLSLKPRGQEVFCTMHTPLALLQSVAGTGHVPLVPSLLTHL